MVTWPAWRLFGRESSSSPGIDLGNGRIMAAEDVLEGHFRRVAARRHPPTQGASPGIHTVEVQVADGLVAAIGVLAPELAPLTALAEDVSTAVPLVQPEAKFRATLQEALERTHRQHAAQRRLGTRPPVAQRAWTEPAPAPLWWLTALLLLVGVLTFWWQRHNYRQPA
jgi:hypothetical protein